jgi:aspartyl-tRNA(Asn)/glutamyl-tRNA(Gln) amidotransferase subunit A
VAPDPSTTGDTRFQAIWSLLGVPTLSLPSGLSAERLPFAIQLAAASWRESTLLAAGRWCEQTLGSLPAPI